MRATASAPALVLPLPSHCFAPPQNDFICQLLETQRPYLTNVARCPALATALLTASRVDVAANGEVVLVDGWLLFKSPVGQGVTRKGKQKSLLIIALTLAHQIRGLTSVALAELADAATQSTASADSGDDDLTPREERIAAALRHHFTLSHAKETLPEEAQTIAATWSAALQARHVSGREVSR